MKINRSILRLAGAGAMLCSSLAASTVSTSTIQKKLSHGHYQAAANAASAFLKTYPHDLQGRFLRGIALAGLRRTKAAIKVFAALAHDYPNRPEPANNLAVLYAREGNYHAAHRWLKAALNSKHPYATAFRNLGIVNTAEAALTYNQGLNNPSRNEPKNLTTNLELIRNFPNVNKNSKQSASTAGMTATVPTAHQGGSRQTGTRVSRRNAVLAVIYAWARAWSNQNTGAYLRTYARNFNPPNGQSLTDWRKSIRRRVVGLASMSLMLSPPRVHFENSHRAVVQFKQNYRTNSYSNRSHKTLVLERTAAGWRIVRESDKPLARSGAHTTRASSKVASSRASPQHAKTAAEWMDAGYAHLNQDEKAAALKAFKHASRLAPKNAEAWKNIGYLDLANGDKTTALKVFERAGRYAPSDPEIWKNVGYLQQNKDDKEAALNAFKRASRYAPKDPEVWKNIGYLDQDLDHNTQALDAFNQASQYAPKDAATWKTIGYLESDRGHKRQALYAFRKTSRLKPNDAEVWTNRGYLASDLGKKVQALSNFRHARKLKPGNSEISLEIGYLESELEQPRQAQKIFASVNRHAQNPQVVQEACSAEHDAALASMKLLPKPNFGDVYFAPYYDHARPRDTIFPFKARLGRHFGANDRGSVYGYLSAQDDTQSRGGRQPDILNDDAAIVGIGMDYQPIAGWPVSVYAEGGYGYDLVERNRSRGRFSYDAGITGYQAWGLPKPHCGERTQWLWTPYTDLYGDLEYDSRQDHDLLFQLRPRFGLAVAQGPWGSARAYLTTNLQAGVKGLYYNNLFEYGPGFAWQFPTEIPIVLRTEYLWGRYLINGENSLNGTHYHGPRVELDLYWAF